MAVIALDLGGTKLATAIFAERGQPQCRNVIQLGGRKGTAVGRLIRDQIETLLKTARTNRIEVTGVGIAVPGIVFPRSGKVWAPNIPGWKNYPLRREVSQLLRRHSSTMRMVIENDRACYVLGEEWRGAARGSRNAVYMGVGTGIGAGILVDGKVVQGAGGIAGAIGWLALDRPYRNDYRDCGCFEHHASGEGLRKKAAKMRQAKAYRDSLLAEFKTLSTRDVFSAFLRGDQLSKKLISEAIECWGMASANLISLFNPEQIIFGGGVFGPAARFLPRIRAEARKWAQPIAFKQVRFLTSKLGPDAGLYGAAFLALKDD